MDKRFLIAYRSGERAGKSDHRNVAGRREIRQKTQCRSTLMSMLTIHRNIGGIKDCGFQSRVSKAMDAYRTFHTDANGVEWYERTPNDE
ncbi:hypothetical protein TNCV_769771 [Trichonephila clavipes]|nr:hypothetical protein TNCV_769771 [Trichonephila clavipes]